MLYYIKFSWKYKYISKDSKFSEMHKYANIKKSILLRFFAKISKSRIAASESFLVPVRQTDDLGKFFEKN